MQHLPQLEAITAVLSQKDGKDYSWGFNMDCQTGQGTDVDIDCTKPIDYPAIRGGGILYGRAVEDNTAC